MSVAVKPEKFTYKGSHYALFKQVDFENLFPKDHKIHLYAQYWYFSDGMRVALVLSQWRKLIREMMKI